MPKIAQIFNNNVALVDLDNRGQAVVRGRGIAFQKRRGDVIPTKQIEKIFYLVPGDLGCGFWPNFSHFIVDLIMQATLFDHNRNWYRKKLKEEVDICQCNRAIHRYHQGLSRSGVH